MESNKDKFVLKIDIESNQDGIVIEGYVYYLFTYNDDAKDYFYTTNQLWNVSESNKNEMIGITNSVSAIKKKYSKVNISGACSDKTSAFVKIKSPEKFRGKYFYSVLPARANSYGCMMSANSKVKNIDWDDFEIVNLEYALKASKSFKKAFEKYNK